MPKSSGGDMQRLSVFSLIVWLCLSLSGCVTNAMFEQKNMHTTEKIKSFLITPDRNTLVVAGEEHHFIFPLAEPLRSLLLWPGRAKLKPTFHAFSVDEKQRIEGSFTLYANASQLTANEKQFLLKQGFTAPNNPAGDYSYWVPSLKGTRYLAGDVKVPQTAYFGQPYTLEIEEPEGAVNTLAKIAVTPLTLAVDGVNVILGGVVLAPFFAVLMQGR